MNADSRSRMVAFNVILIAGLGGCVSFQGALLSEDWSSAAKYCQSKSESDRAVCLRVLGAAQWGKGAHKVAANTWREASISEDEATFLADRASQQGEKDIAESLLRSAKVPCVRGVQYSSLRNIAGGRPSDSIAAYQACGMPLEQARKELVLDYRRLLFPKILEDLELTESAMACCWDLSRDGQFLFRVGRGVTDLATGKSMPMSSEVCTIFDATWTSDEKCELNIPQRVRDRRARPEDMPSGLPDTASLSKDRELAGYSDSGRITVLGVADRISRASWTGRFFGDQIVFLTGTPVAVAYVVSNPTMPVHSSRIEIRSISDGKILSMVPAEMPHLWTSYYSNLGWSVLPFSIPQVGAIDITVSAWATLLPRVDLWRGAIDAAEKLADKSELSRLLDEALRRFHTDMLAEFFLDTGLSKNAAWEKIGASYEEIMTKCMVDLIQVGFEKQDALAAALATKPGGTRVLPYGVQDDRRSDQIRLLYRMARTTAVNAYEIAGAKSKVERLQSKTLEDLSSQHLR